MLIRYYVHFGFDGTDTTVSLKLLSLWSHRYIEMVEADAKSDLDIHRGTDEKAQMVQCTIRREIFAFNR
jgi:hypothetical protein